MGVNKRSLNSSDWNFIRVSEVDQASGIIDPKDITPAAGSFSGLDLHVDNIVGAASRALELELGKYGLEVISTDRGRALRTTRVTWQFQKHLPLVSLSYLPCVGLRLFSALDDP